MRRAACSLCDAVELGSPRMRVAVVATRARAGLTSGRAGVDSLFASTPRARRTDARAPPGGAHFAAAVAPHHCTIVQMRGLERCPNSRQTHAERARSRVPPRASDDSTPLVRGAHPHPLLVAKVWGGIRDVAGRLGADVNGSFWVSNSQICRLIFDTSLPFRKITGLTHGEGGIAKSLDDRGPFFG